MILNIYFRTFTIGFPQLKDQAQQEIELKIYKDTVSEIERKFPAADSLIKGKLVDKMLSVYGAKNNRKILKQIRQEYLKLKDRYQDKFGQTYLLELDGWHYARYVENALRLGRVGEEIRSGKEIDTFMLAPEGSSVTWSRFLFYLSSFLYRVFSLFKPVPLYTFLFYLPLFFTAIFIVLLYLFCFSRWGNFSAGITCLCVGLSPIFLVRSSAGWFDTDILNLLFPLLVVWTYLKVYEAGSLRIRLFWVCFSAFWVGLFSFTWREWWFIFFLIILYEIYSLLNLILLFSWKKEREKLTLARQHLFCLLSFLLSCLLWVILFSGFAPIIAVFAQAKGALTLNSSLTDLVWPNTYSTVEELRKVDLRQIGRMFGGEFLFISSLIGMLMFFLRTLYNPKFNGPKREAAIILAFWSISMLFACSRGARFTMFLLIPLGISLGWLINEIYLYYYSKNNKLIIFVVLLIVPFLILGFVDKAYKTAEGIFPIMDDDWHRVLTRIEATTPGEAIINSWWDFGDWFKAVARRRVIFDGHSQDRPQAYWMANVLVTDNEEEALRTLRMLNNGGNRAFEIINKYTNDPFRSVLLLKRILLSAPRQAKENLLNNLPSLAAEEIMKLLFAKPGKAYFIVEYTMKNKIPAISFLGNWDFAKVYLSQNINRKSRLQILNYLKGLGLDGALADRLYQEATLLFKEDFEYWVSRRFRFHGDVLKGQRNNNIILFDRGLIYNPAEQTAYLYSPKENSYEIPKELFIFENNKLKKASYQKNNLSLSVLILKDKEDYEAVLFDPPLINSLFMRLYFLRGTGLKYFRPFIEEKTPDGYIRVFEIDWDSLVEGINTS